MHEAFFSTAAQVIPLLYLTIVFEQRIWQGRRPHTFFGIETMGVSPKLVGTLIVLLVAHLVAGEAVALTAVASGGGCEASYVVAGSMALAGVVVIGPVLIMGLQPLMEEWATERDPSWDLKLGSHLIRLFAWGAVAHTLVVIGVVLF